MSRGGNGEVAKQRRRSGDIRYGDGYIQERIRANGEPSLHARWSDGQKLRSQTFRPPDGSPETLDHRMSIARTRAVDFLRQRGREVRSGRYVAHEDVTLIQAIDGYIERGAARWKSSTVATYGDVRNVIARHKIGSVRLSELTPWLCQQWIDEMVRLYSANRMVVVRAVVNGALREAMRLGVIHTNPMQGVRMPSPKKREYDVWTPAEAGRAISLSREDPLLHPYYVVALTTGMRPGEIRALRWGDIDLDNRRITVARTLTRDANHSPIIGTSTKGGRARRVSIPASAVETLKTHRSRQNERRLRSDRWHDGDLVFDRGNGEPIPQQTVWRRHREFAAAQQLPICRLHDLRHTAATLLFQAGIPVKVISDMLGHSSVIITMDIYAHSDETMQRDAADTLSSVLALDRKTGAK